MKKVNEISCFEYGILIYFIIRSMSLGISINSYIHIGGVDGYLSPIIGMIIGIIPLYIFLKIFNYKEELNIYEKIDYLFGKKIGSIINIILSLFIFFLILIAFFNLINFISSQYLFRTSNLYVAILFGICFIYTCTKKINVLVRAANLLFYISVIIFLICVMGLIGNIRIDNIKPFLEHGIKPPLISGISHVAYTILPLFILLMIPKKRIKNSNNINKFIIIFYLIANIGKFTTTFYTISSFGIDLAKLYEFPDFVLLRRISTTGFFQRFESILAIQWIFDIYMIISLCFFYLKFAYKHMINNKYDNKFITITILISCVICSNFLFKSNTSADTFILYYLPFILGIFLFLIPLIIFIRIKKTT